MKKLKNGENMSIAVSINSSGQATIPKAVREYLGVVPGENRIVFDVVNGKVILTREPSRTEMLDASMRRIQARNAKEEQQNPKVREAKEKYKGMGYEEVMDAYYSTPEGKKEFEEEYGIKL